MPLLIFSLNDRQPHYQANINLTSSTRSIRFLSFHLSEVKFCLLSTTLYFYYPTNYPLKQSMPLNYRDTSIAYISCMVYFCNKVDKLSYRKQFETTLSCIDKNSKIPDDELLTDDLRCQLICTIGDFLSEPTENTVGLCM